MVYYVTDMHTTLTFLVVSVISACMGGLFTQWYGRGELDKHPPPPPQQPPQLTPLMKMKQIRMMK